jgi:hypothetical protein
MVIVRVDVNSHLRIAAKCGSELDAYWIVANPEFLNQSESNESEYADHN